MINLVKDTIDEEDINVLVEWLKTYPRLTQGEIAKAFEKKWSKWLGVKYSVFVNSGSSANLLMLYTLKENGISNNKVVVPSLSWATTVAPVLQFGMEPILCDVDEETLGIDVKHLERIFKKDKPAVLLMANILGFPCKLDEITSLCRRYGVILLEDSCETVGSTYKGIKTGNFGLMSTFSFYFGHHISTIEGGMVCTDDEELYNLLKMIRSHGWDRDSSEKYQKKYREEYNVDEFDAFYKFYHPGFNLRSTDLQAHIGMRQIDKLDDICMKRQDNFWMYDEQIKNDYWKISPNKGEIVSNFSYPIIHPRKKKIVEELIKNEIECRPLVCGSMHRQPFFIKNMTSHECSELEDNLTFANVVDNYGLYVPNHPKLEKEDIDKICKIVNEVLK